MSSLQEPIEVFCSYAHEDEDLCCQLRAHLSPLQRQGLLNTWYDRLIIAGTDWTENIDTHLQTASLVLLLISPDFFASDYCYGKEMSTTLQRHKANKARVIPVLLRPVHWHDAPFAQLQVLPSNAKPITRWRNRDDAFADVVGGIRRAIGDLSQLSLVAPANGFTGIWNVPVPRNITFTGREDLLSLLALQLRAHQALALSQRQGISGLGGVGKTQLAVEYAYRHVRDYRAVLWVRADSRDTLIASFVELAGLLSLPEREERDQDVIIAAVKRWLAKNDRWLLILDNADQLDLMSEFLPPTLYGHVLLTTRAHALGGLASRIEVETMDQQTGALLLLRRAGVLALDVTLDQASQLDRSLAREICRELGGLPLALDQAGAYIEETQSSLADYLDLYRRRRMVLLERRGGLLHDHPEPVTTTWSLSFAAVEQRSLAAADLLRACALLHPDAIPEELFRQGAAYLGPALAASAADPLIWNIALAAASSYSLLRRSSTDNTLSMHRLVQVVLQESMEEQEHQEWLARIIEALDAVFPEIDYSTWSQCERFIPHTLVCAASTTSWEIPHLGLASLLYKTAHYLFSRGQHVQAEPLYLRTLRFREQALGSEHPEMAYPLIGLGNLYQVQGRYAEAEPLYQRALCIQEHAFGPEHFEVAMALGELASLYRDQGRYGEAEPLYQQALRITEQTVGPEHLSVTYTLIGLTLLYMEQGRYLETETLCQRALHIAEQVLIPTDPWLAGPLNNLAELYTKQGRYAEAELHYQRALQIWEQAYDPEYSEVAHPLYGLANLYREQGRYAEAESCDQRALHIRNQTLGPEHQLTLKVLHDFAVFHHAQNNVSKAEALYQHALAARERSLGPSNVKTVETRMRYAARNGSAR